MKDIYKEITKEIYDRYLSMSVGDWKAEVRKTIPIEWECGYGYYGTDLVARDGKYYIVHTLGSTCD